MVPEKVVESLLFSEQGCSDPLLRTVSRSLPAPGSSATDLALRGMDLLTCNSRLQLRFTSQKKPVRSLGWDHRGRNPDKRS